MHLPLLLSDLNLEGLPLALVRPTRPDVLAFNVDIGTPFAALEEDHVAWADHALAGALLLPNLKACNPAAVLIDQTHHVALDVDVPTVKALDVNPVAMADVTTALLLNGEVCPWGTDCRPRLDVLRVLLGVQVVALGSHEEDDISILDGLSAACGGLLLSRPPGNNARAPRNPLHRATRGRPSGTGASREDREGIGQQRQQRSKAQRGR
mmetsp:Transcript_5753/g.15936  ORF Transcript_5753/g.15936 Transcript_5753/m.15936 type:complete len:209 (+) Transcript_5753:136-762(+)